MAGTMLKLSAPGSRHMLPPNEHMQASAAELDLIGLHHALSRLYDARALVGGVPAGPPTVRARVSAVLIGFIRRSLFWLLPQLDGFHAAVIEFSQQQLSMTGNLVNYMAALDEEVDRLRVGTVAQGSERSRYRATELSPELWLKSVHRRAAEAPSAHKEDGRDLPGPVGV